MKTWDRQKNLPTCETCGGKVRGDNTYSHRRKCEVCGKRFCDPNGVKKTCSKKCRYELTSKSNRGNDTGRGENWPHCDLCGKPHRPRQKSGVHNRRCVICRTRFCSADKSKTCSPECFSELNSRKSAAASKQRWETRKKNGIVCKTCGHTKLTKKSRYHDRVCKGCGHLYCSHLEKQLYCTRRCAKKYSFGGGIGKGGYRPDIGIFVRSTWEANYARILNLRGTAWKYEARTFRFEDGTSYTPDFQLGKSDYVEVKGYKSPEWMEKRAKFEREYPEIDLRVVGPRTYEKLRGRYETRIEWEN